MKKLRNILLITILILTVAGVIAVPHQADASIFDFLKCTANPVGCAEQTFTNVMYSFFAEIGNTILSLVSWVVTLAGTVLNVSILLTMNIKAIYDSTPAIEQVWVIIRNISSLFIIFGLLYTSIATILDVAKTSIKSLVLKIIIAGLLINFSLFFTKVLIDGSNLISLSIYRAIAPSSESMLSKGFNAGSLLTESYYDGGISAIFMQSLKLPTVFNNKQGLITNDSSKNYLNIAISTFFGSFLMVVAALSFFAAALAFTVRLVALLLLMGFSPVYFAGMIFPALKKDLADRWMGYLSKQLIFMPVYLLFMYVALKFISSNGGQSFFAALDLGRNSVGQGPSGILLASVGLLMQYTIAFILINIPLIAALETGAIGIKWVEGANKTLHGFMGQHTLGRAANRASSYLGSTDFAKRNPNMAILANNALKGVSGGSFGGSKGGFDKRNKDYVQARVDYGNKNLKLGTADKEVAAGRARATMVEYENKSLQKTREILKAREEYRNAVSAAGPDSEQARNLAGKIRADEAALEQTRNDFRNAVKSSGAGSTQAKELMKKIEAESAALDKKKTEYSNATMGENSEQAKKLAEKIRKDEEELNKMETEKENAAKAAMKAAEGDVLKEKKEKYAENLEKKGSIWTGARIVGAPSSKANKEAADSLRKEMNKSEEKQLLDTIKKLAADAEKGAAKE